MAQRDFIYRLQRFNTPARPTRVNLGIGEQERACVLILTKAIAGMPRYSAKRDPGHQWRTHHQLWSVRANTLQRLFRAIGQHRRTRERDALESDEKGNGERGWTTQ